MRLDTVKETDDDGTVCIADAGRGIGLVCEPPQDRWWIVLSMFLRTDMHGVSEPFITRYGLN